MNWRAAILHYLTVGAFLLLVLSISQIDRWFADANRLGIFATLFFVVAVFFILLTTYIHSALYFLQKGE